MLLARDSSRFSPARALLLSASWASGAAFGVALGGWLTVVGGAGAPGASGLGTASDLVVLPGVAFVVVAVVQFAVRLAAAAFRGRAHGRVEHQHDCEHAEDDSVLGQVGPERSLEEGSRGIGGGRDGDRRP